MTCVQYDRSKVSFAPPSDRTPAEDGYILLAAIFLLAILVLSLSVAVPVITRGIQRDREREAIRRGNQYRRAIQLYYRKFHVYPPSVAALEQTDDIRFLRRRYTDPITRKDDWAPIQFGNNKVPTSFGFFGQTLLSTSIAGTGPNVPQAVPNQSQGGEDTLSGSGLIGSTAPSSGERNAPAFGGQGIIGFSIPSDRTSIVVYKKQNHYNMWEFVYDPIQDLRSGSAGGTGTGLNPGVQGLPGGSPPPSINGPPPTVLPPPNGDYGPNGNLPSSGPGSGPSPTGPWGPNGNLPTPP